MTDDHEVKSLKQRIKQLEADNFRLAQQKAYGLTWDEDNNSDEKVKWSKENLPYVQFDPSWSINQTFLSHCTHTLIKGDNYLALLALLPKYQGKIDCIYIDPPYNTGRNKDFLYNDNFVKDDDSYRHSKWLNFMKPRLELAKKLLTENGVIFVSIDDNEQAHLRLLLDQIFGEKNGKMVVVKMSEVSGLKMSSVQRLGTIPKLKEYLFIYKFGGVKNLWFDLVPKERWDDGYTTFLENFSQELRTYLASLEELEDITGTIVKEANEKLKDVKLVSVAEKIKELGLSKGKALDAWRFENSWRIVQLAQGFGLQAQADAAKADYQEQDLFLLLSKRDRIPYLIKSNYNSVEGSKARIQAIFADVNLAKHPGDFWEDIKTTSLGSEGAGIQFKNGKKPLSLIRRVVKSIDKKNAIILDFFAGSGTTAQAVIDLNEEDGGTRTCILVTDEGKPAETGIDIADNVTYERLKRILTGKGWADGKEHPLLEQSLQYGRIKSIPLYFNPLVDYDEQDEPIYAEEKILASADTLQAELMRKGKLSYDEAASAYLTWKRESYE